MNGCISVYLDTGQLVQDKQSHHIHLLGSHAHPLLPFQAEICDLCNSFYKAEGPSSTILRNILLAEEFHYTQAYAEYPQLVLTLEIRHDWKGQNQAPNKLKINR